MRRRKQAAMAQRRKQEQEVLAQRRKQELQKKKARAQAMKRYIGAAVVIQRAFRAHRARKEEQEKTRAARVITAAVRRAGAFQQAQRITESLRHLHRTRASIRAVRRDFEARPAGYRNQLFFVDSLEKLIFALDAVPTLGSPFVRAFRKAVVNEAQEGLRFADVVFSTMNRCVRTMQRAVRQYLTHGAAEKEQTAARVITCTLRAMPVVRKAKKEAQVVSLLRTKRRRLTELREEYTKQLNDIVQSLGALAADGELGQELKREVMQEAQATLSTLTTGLAKEAAV